MRLCEYPNGCIIPVFGTDKNTGLGYCKKHQYLRTDIDRRSLVVKAMSRARQNNLVVSGSLLSEVESTNAELNRWFEDRRKEMDGKCSNCGGVSCMMDNKYFKFSIAHILPKAYFPSIATHESNWIELCFWGKSCHTNFDNKILDLTEMNCWNEIVIKFQKMYPAIAANERKRIPDVLLQYVGTDF